MVFVCSYCIGLQEWLTIPDAEGRASVHPSSPVDELIITIRFSVPVFGHGIVSLSNDRSRIVRRPARVVTDKPRPRPCGMSN